MLEPLFPVTYSLVAPDALLQVIAHTYPLSEFVSCRLYRVSWNSTYLLSARHAKFVVRVYGADWHSRSAIDYELQLLCHLAASGCGVAAPLARTDSTFLTPIAAPEGTRYIAVFPHAPGIVPAPFPLGDASQSVYFGRALAELHRAAQSFTPSATRLAHTTATIIDKPLDTLQPFLTHRPADWKYLRHVASVVRERLDHNAHQLTWGVIHADPFSANATLDKDNQVTWYDFDLCGPGWHLSDVADGYASAMGQERSTEDKEAVWQSFLHGYRSIRDLPEEHLTLIPVLLAARTIYFMSLNARKGLIKGFEYWGSDEFFDDWLKLTHSWMERIDTFR